MRLLRLELWLCMVALALLAGCASPGVPLPPSLELARPVTDLRASRKGNKVYLTWSIPVHTTDHQNLRHGGTAEVCRELGTKTKICDTPITRIAFQQPSRNKTPASTVNYTDELPSNLQAPPTSDLVYAVRILNPYGRSAGSSNQVRVSAAPTQAAPTDFHAQLTAEGVELTWRAVPTLQMPGLRLLYRVYRREHGSNAEAIAGEVAVEENQTNPSLLDRSFEWEKTSDYHATVVTIVSAASGNAEQVEGEDTPPIEIVAHDVFPPATPVGLQAVFSGPGQKPFVDLIWTPNTEADLAGYNVFRREDNGEQTKLNSDLVKSPTFRDTAVEPGRRYAYSISAVDVRGNESGHSEEASETVPGQ